MTTPELHNCAICDQPPRLDERTSPRRFTWGAHRPIDRSYAFVCSNRHCIAGRTGVYSGNIAYARTRWNRENGGQQ